MPSEGDETLLHTFALGGKHKNFSLPASESELAPLVHLVALLEARPRRAPFLRWDFKICQTLKCQCPDLEEDQSTYGITRCVVKSSTLLYFSNGLQSQVQALRLCKTTLLPLTSLNLSKLHIHKSHKR